MSIRPYILLKRSVVATLEARAHAACAQWAAQWVSLADDAITVTSASSMPSDTLRGPWHGRRLASGQVAWVADEAACRLHFEKLLFENATGDASRAPHKISSIAAAVSTEAFDDLCATLLHSLTGRTSAPGHDAPVAADGLPRDLLRPGSGAAVCQIVFGDLTIRLLLAHDCLCAQATATESRREVPALAGLRQALARAPLGLHVELGRAELTVGALHTLGVGDVLSLPMSLDEPLCVLGPGDVAICDAHLGHIDRHRAVELVRHNRASDHS